MRAGQFRTLSERAVNGVDKSAERSGDDARMQAHAPDSVIVDIGLDVGGCRRVSG